MNVNNFPGDYYHRRLALAAAVKASVLAFLTVRHLHTLADSYELYTTLLEERRAAAAAMLCPTRCEYSTAAEIIETLAAESRGADDYVRKVLDASSCYSPDEAEALLVVSGLDDPTLEAARLRSRDAFRTLEGPSEAARRDAASSLIIRFRGRLLTARGVSDLLAKSSDGNSCIPETFEYDWACRILDAMHELDEVEREALTVYSGVSPESLGEYYSGMREAVAEAAYELYGSPADHY